MALLVTPLADNHARIRCVSCGQSKIMRADRPGLVAAETVRLERRHSCAAV